MSWLERAVLAALAAAMMAVLVSIVLINLPPSPAPGPELLCSEWREHAQIQAYVGPTGSTHRTCTQYEWSHDE